MRFRLGVLGGMFDPVHNGHMEIARRALGELALDAVKMTPCHIPNHRDSAQVGSIHRLNMVELAAADELKIHVDPIEINRSGTSYTVNTLATLKRNDGDCSLVLILGVDSFNTIPQWQSWPELLQLCHFLILGRPGVTLCEDVIAALDFNCSLVESADELFRCESGKIRFLSDFSLDISSTGVRELLATNADLSSMLDRKVIDYILSNKLYAAARN